MALFPDAFLDRIRDGEADDWPAVLARRDAVRGSLEVALASQAPDVRDALVQPLVRDASGAAWARAALWGLSIAGVAGFTATEVVDDFAFHLRGPDGRAFVLSPMAFRTRSSDAGAPEHVQALLEVLEQALSEHRFVVHIKKPLPPDFDPAPVRQAVQLWLMAMRQGTWRGRYAVYEDGDVSVEIGLTDLPRRPGVPGRVAVVEPHRSLERMAEVDARVVELAGTLSDRCGDVPVVVLLAAQPRWSLSRGYVKQLLYGTPRTSSSERHGDDASLRVTYESNGLSLFSDPLCRNLVGLWWVEPAGGSLGLRGWAHANPWCASADRAAAFPGLRYERVEGTAGDRLATMSWSGREPTTWRPPR